MVSRSGIPLGTDLVPRALGTGCTTARLRAWEMRVSTYHYSELNWGLACVSGSMSFMVQGRMILGAVVDKICAARSPVEAELALGFTAVEPTESHVHGFNVFGDDGLVDDTGGSGVVGLDGRLGLRPTHFD